MTQAPLLQADMKSAILGYLALLRDEPDTGPGRLERLAEALDLLVTTYHRTPAVEPDTDASEAPRIDYHSLMKRAAASFPELGLYGDADPEDMLDQQVGLGDAIDDLADIARDLTEVLWLIENASTNDAIWHFRDGYQTHWGRHLHDVRRYLYAVIY